MPVPCRLVLLLAGVVLAVSVPLHAQTAGGENVIAPVFPNAIAVPESHSMRTMPAFRRTADFFAAAPVEEVIAFYAAHLGEEPSFSGEGAAFTWVLMSGEEVRAAGNHPPRPSRDAYRPAILVVETGRSVYAPGPATRYLEDLRRHAPRIPEFPDEAREQFFERYGYLATAYFLDGVVEEVLRECGLDLEREAEEAFAESLAEQQPQRRNPEEVQRMMEAGLMEKLARLHRLVEAGRIEEAAKLQQEIDSLAGDSAREEPGPTDAMYDPYVQWRRRASCLERLEPHAYRTLIRIPTDPAGWTSAQAHGVPG